MTKKWVRIKRGDPKEENDRRRAQGAYGHDEELAAAALIREGRDRKDIRTRGRIVDTFPWMIVFFW